MSEKQLSGKTAIITGASKGIGREIAERFAREGANVAICSRSVERIKPVATGINKTDTPGHAHAIECDVTDSDMVADFVDSTIDEFGGIDILVNNAGGAISDDSLHRIDEETFDRNIEVNLKGQYLVASEVLPAMVAENGGSMVHMGSVNGLFGIGLTAYSAAKGGILALSRNIATQYARFGIRSNVISPGTIQTENRQVEMDETEERTADREQNTREEWIDQYPPGRFGRPDEIADATLFLASEQSSFVNGTNLVVDGGLTAGLDNTFQTRIYQADEQPTRDRDT